MCRMILTISALLFLGEMTAGARAQERLNLAYISPTAGSSSIFWVAELFSADDAPENPSW
jgi:hypothetical protein